MSKQSFILASQPTTQENRILQVITDYCKFKKTLLLYSLLAVQ